MIKVTLYVDSFKEPFMESMKQWCRDQFGKNVKGQPAIWRSFYNRSFYNKPSYIFFFSEEKDASWFSLKWANNES